MKYTVATYNIQHCADSSRRAEKPLPVDVEKTGAYINRLQADVVGLNEVFSTGGQEEFCNQTEKLAKIAGYAYAEFAKGKTFDWAEIGNALLSKYPLTDIQKIPVLAPTEEERFPNETQWYEDRVILKATVNAESPFDILVTHFGLNGQEQMRMMDVLLPLIDKCKRPFILLGDFNVMPSNGILQPLYARLRSTADVAQDTSYTFPSWGTDRTIDYIFVSKEWKVLAYEVGNEVVSDHLPVKTILQL